MDTCAPYSGTLVLHSVNTNHVDTSNQLTRFASTSFFHNVNLLRRHYSPEDLKLLLPVKKIDNAFRSFLTSIEALKASTPCLVGRFHCDKLQKIFSVLNKENAALELEGYRAAKERGITFFPIYGIDRKCQDLDEATGNTHVSIETWLDSFQTEGEESENFEQYCLRKIASRIHVYTTLLIDLDCHQDDLKILQNLMALRCRISLGLTQLQEDLSVSGLLLKHLFGLRHTPLRHLLRNLYRRVPRFFMGIFHLHAIKALLKKSLSWKEELFWDGLKDQK